ncbi:MAG: hypothetical protein ACKO82_05900, partial [Acidimicrobiaceae bacterium]
CGTNIAVIFDEKQGLHGDLFCPEVQICYQKVTDLSGFRQTDRAVLGCHTGGKSCSPLTPAGGGWQKSRNA